MSEPVLSPPRKRARLIAFTSTRSPPIVSLIGVRAFFRRLSRTCSKLDNSIFLHRRTAKRGKERDFLVPSFSRFVPRVKTIVSRAARSRIFRKLRNENDAKSRRTGRIVNLFLRRDRDCPVINHCKILKFTVPRKTSSLDARRPRII